MCVRERAILLSSHTHYSIIHNFSLLKNVSVFCNKNVHVVEKICVCEGVHLGACQIPGNFYSIHYGGSRYL